MEGRYLIIETVKQDLQSNEKEQELLKAEEKLASEKNIHGIIARELKIKKEQVTSTVTLLDDSNTIPFIARYRKEVTGELDEEQIRTIEERLAYLRNLSKRREEIIASITSQEKMTPELAQAIIKAEKLQELEDLYLPYRPKKRTRAQIALEKGLLPLAELIIEQNSTNENLDELAAPYLSEENKLNTTEEVFAGAMDIIAEQISDTASYRELIRDQLWRNAELSSELAVDEQTGKDFLNYKEYSEPIRLMPPHRILAINRGENKEFLKVRLIAPHETIVDKLSLKIIHNYSSTLNSFLQNAIADSYKRLILPSLDREIRSEMTMRAERQAINVFARNLRQLILQTPLANHTIMGLDPGFRTGCKVAVIDRSGKELATSTIYLSMSKSQLEVAEKVFLDLVKAHNVTLVSIGNGTASYETENFVARLINEHSLDLQYIITNEAGASVYSASKLAKEELPHLDVSLRGAVSIARRVQDPLAELVKIEPKAIGVGQYQHDVNQKDLTKSLGVVIESCVNHVGVDLNTSSPALLGYVAGIQASVAKNIVAWRNENGEFKNRKQLLKVPRLGPAAFTQCAGFLRINSGENPLDNTPVHPESYELASKIIEELGFSLKSKKPLPQELLVVAAQANAEEIAEKLVAGVPTVKDILSALSKPGRDPREDTPKPMTRKNITKLSDLAVGTIVKGTVHNITDFGVFVDIGIKINGLIHRSELSKKPFRHPLDIVSVGNIIDVMIINIDEARGRIGLSLKQVDESLLPIEAI